MLTLAARYKFLSLLTFGSLFLAWLIAGNSVATAQVEPVDITFKSGSGLSGSAVRTIVVQPDGKILVGGSFNTFNNAGRNGILRLDANGNLDSSFNPGFGIDINQNEKPLAYQEKYVQTIALQQNGKILVGGNFDSFNGVIRKNLVRLNSDGSLDQSFNAGGSGISMYGLTILVHSIVVQPDDKILVGGVFFGYNDVARSGLVRLNADGSLDNSFNNGGSGTYSLIETIALQNDGKILIGGFFPDFNGVKASLLARLNPDGSIDASFPINKLSSGTYVSKIKVQADGRILIAGKFNLYGETFRPNLVRLTTNGELDASFSPSVDQYMFINALELQADGKILIGGSLRMFTNPPGDLQRLLEDGSTDSSFNPNNITVGSFTIMAIAVRPANQILIGGSFTQVGAFSRNYFAQLSATGELDTNFYSDTNTGVAYSVIASVRDILVLPDDKILIAGVFTTYNSISISHFARLNPDGTPDSSFNSGGSGPNLSVNTIARQADGKILIGGSFNLYNGIARNRLARLNPDGSLDNLFNPPPAASDPFLTVSSLIVQADGKIIVASNSQQSSRAGFVQRLNPDGTLDSSFTTATLEKVSIAATRLQNDGKILVGGEFISTGGITGNALFRLNADGSLDSTFNPGSGPNKAVYALEITGDNKILVGGVFSSYNGQAVGPLIRLNSNGSLDTSFTPSSADNGLPGVYGSNRAVLSIFAQNDGQILAGGKFINFNGQYHSGLVQLTANGDLVPTFNFNIDENRDVLAITIQNDGKILLGGSFTRVNNTTRGGLARLVANPTWPGITLTSNPNPSLFGEPATFTVQLAPLAATGVVTFTFDFNSVAVRPLVNGVATYTTSSLPIGNRQVQIYYSGDNTYPPISGQFLNHTVTTPCNLALVTSPVDNGAGTVCGTFSYALAAATSGTTITFGLPQGNVITFSGSLIPSLALGVYVDGGASGIVLDGTGQTGDGLRLAGSNRLSNLTVRGFAGRGLVVNKFGWNRFYKLRVEK